MQFNSQGELALSTSARISSIVFSLIFQREVLESERQGLLRSQSRELLSELLSIECKRTSDLFTSVATAAAYRDRSHLFIKTR